MFKIILDILVFVKDIVILLFSSRLVALLVIGILCYFFRSRIKALVIKVKDIIVNKVKSIFKKEK